MSRLSLQAIAQGFFTFAATEDSLRAAKAKMMDSAPLTERAQVECDRIVVGLIEQHYKVKATEAAKNGKLSMLAFEGGTAAQKRHSRCRMLITGKAQEAWRMGQKARDAYKKLDKGEQQSFAVERACESLEKLAKKEDLSREAKATMKRHLKSLLLLVS